MSCRFYGKCWAGSSFGLVDSLGNQCGAIRRAHAPCRMEILGSAPDETVCALATSEPESTIFDRIGETVRIRLPRSPWIEAKVIVASLNGRSRMLQLDKPLVSGRPIAVHPSIGFVAMPMHVSGDRWRDTVTGAYCEIEIVEKPAPGPLQADSGGPGNASTHSQTGEK